jgi:DMSO/TMAO reductase YedYZ molybdopterin-dependent catalytic subunit
LSQRIYTRRAMLVRSASALSTLYLSACDRLSEAPSLDRVLRTSSALTYRAQRLLIGSQSLAREFGEADLSSTFRSNGSTMPESEEYQRLLAGNFESWRLEVAGLVGRPLRLSLLDLRRLSARTQITRHDCVEGWSAIGKWNGVRLSAVLDLAQIQHSARYIVFYCADRIERVEDPYYESLDLIDALHPQTILAYELNGAPLPVPNGAPLRLRVERQLGYKHAKFLMRIEAVERLDAIGGGRGGYWEDRGYDWYAGI